MEVKKYSPREYDTIFQNPYHVYNTGAFNLLNANYKNIEIECLSFKTKKYKLGLIGAVIDKKFRSSFSAPFGGFSFLKNDVSLETIDSAIDLFLDYCKSCELNEVELILPPLFYDENFISKLNNCLYRKKFILSSNDLNFSIHLHGTIEDYENTLQYNAKKNLTISLTKNFEFKICETEDDKLLAYEIIKKNREAKDFNLSMTYDKILSTIKLVKTDFFLLQLDAEPVASAMVFHVAKNIVQVIYWGDLPEFSNHKTMNYLSYSVVSHYYKTDIKIIDIGPSTQDSIPMYGVCDFKESIGCKINPKLTWQYLFNSSEKH